MNRQRLTRGHANFFKELRLEGLCNCEGEVEAEYLKNRSLVRLGEDEADSSSSNYLPS